MSAARLKPIEAASLTPEQRHLYDAILHGRRATGHVGVPLTGKGGALVGPFSAMLLSPSVGDAVQKLGEDVRFGTDLSQRQREMAILLVAAKTGSSFEWYAHAAIARLIGMSEDVISSLELGEKPDDLTPEEGAVFDIASELLARDRVQDSTYNSAVSVLGERAVFEVAVVVGYYRMIAGILGTFAIEAPT